SVYTATCNSRASLLVGVCAVTYTSSFSFGSTSDESPASALLKSLIDRSSLAHVGWIRTRNTTTQKMRRIMFDIFIRWSGFSHFSSAIATITACLVEDQLKQIHFRRMPRMLTKKLEQTV